MNIKPSYSFLFNPFFLILECNLFNTLHGLLDIPNILLPVIFSVFAYAYFLLEFSGQSKTQSVLIFIAGILFMFKLGWIASLLILIQGIAFVGKTSYNIDRGQIVKSSFHKTETFLIEKENITLSKLQALPAQNLNFGSIKIYSINKVLYLDGISNPDQVLFYIKNSL